MKTIERLILATGVAALTACGGDSNSVPGGGPEAQAALIYSYPIHQQNEVPTPAPVVLRFSESIEGQGLENDILLRQNGQEVETETHYADNGRSLILTPEDGLEFHADYVVDFADDFPLSVSDITFRTKAAQEGPRTNVISGEGMTLTRILPSDGEHDPIMDFSTLRLQFTQPIDHETVHYGTGADDTVALVDDNDDLVPAWVVVDGPYLTIDPKEDLTPGNQYRIRFGNDEVQSIYGESFAYANEPRYRFTPASSLAQGTEPDERPLPLVQRITTPEDEGAGDGLSSLTGQPVNEIPVNAVLLGDQTTTFMPRTQQEGDVLGDLAYLPNWPTVSPLRIRRGTLLTGSNIDVKIGGEVDAGFDSGEVRVHFLSDATGYLMPNIYDPDGPRLVRLFLDVALSTEDPTANGGVTQDITHLELIGTVTTDTDEGVIDINAVGVVEPMILGQERGYGTLSFQLQTDRDQTEELVEQTRQESEDLTPPELQSWTLGDDSSSGDDKAKLYKPGDSIVLNFNEPIKRESVAGRVILYGLDGNPMPIDYYVDGAALVIKPTLAKEDYQGGNGEYMGSRSERPLRVMPSAIPENQAGEYHLQVDGGITDLAGNAMGGSLDEEINLSKQVEEVDVITASSQPGLWDTLRKHSPIVLSAYPGFPCVLSQDGRELGPAVVDIENVEMGWAGRCLGGYPGSSGENNAHIIRPKDDVLPVLPLPANRPIIVQFNKQMDPASFVLGTTFKVEAHTEQGTEAVPGTLSVTGRTLKFSPIEPWDEGRLYQYELASSGFEYGEGVGGTPKIIAADDFECGTNAVCDYLNNLPLQTRALGSAEPIEEGDSGIYEINFTGPDFDAGGPIMTQFFRGAPSNNHVLQVLSTAPLSDVNHNFYHEADSEDDAVYKDPLFGASLGRYEYGAQEYGPTTEFDDRYPDLDPEGVNPGKNSAKILSRGQSEGVQAFPYISGVNIGCVFDYTNGTTTGCAQDVFTYLNSAIVAEVTDEVIYEDEKARIKVKMWPSQVAGTSIKMMGLLNAGVVNTQQAAETGPQYLRMRYAENSEGERNQPIIGWIKEEDGTPILEASVELYLNAPYSAEWGVGGSQNFVNTISYPITMMLKGPIAFLDDGRMIVEQYNENLVNIDIEFGSCSPDFPGNCNQVGYGDLFIPEKGSRLNFVSELIK